MATILINGSHPEWLVKIRGPLIRELAARGHAVHVSSPDLASQSAGLAALPATAHEVPLGRTGQNAIADLRYFHALRALIRRIEPDLVLGYTIKPNIWGSLAAASLGVRSASMLTGLGYAFMSGTSIPRRLVSAVARRLYRAATARNDVVIFQNRDDLEDFVAAGCLVDRSKARVVNGSGVDLDEFMPAPLPSDPVFLMVARLLVSKGVREYAAAAASILARRKDARFLLGGWIDDSPDAIGFEELERWQRAGIEYLGRLEDIRPALAQASVYVLPSYREGTPRTVLEAMAMGRPIITTDVPGCRETVRDGANGALVRGRDARSLERAMIKLADSPDLRERMGRESLDLARMKYDARKVSSEIISYLGLH